VIRSGAAPNLPDLRILHLSDLHLAPRDRDRMRWVQSLGALAPDLVVVTGDFHGHADGGRLALAALRPLLEIPGLFVHGSNDFFTPKAINPAKYFKGPSSTTREPDIDLQVLDRGLTQAGWLCLDNLTSLQRIAGWRVASKGCGDAHMQADRYADVAGPYPDADLRLGVTHSPYLRVLDAMVGDGADLILAGHTHGGQIALPHFGALVTNCDLPRDRAKGLSEWQGVPLHVSGGLGTNPYTPIRFACRPEASLITITAG
jgi:predicted MPP superfamily phosphohydrolase